MLRARVEILPDVGARWKAREITPQYGVTRTQVVLLHRDPIETVAQLLADPLLAPHLSYEPKRIYSDDERTNRLYSEMDSADWWWETQVHPSHHFEPLHNLVHRNHKLTYI